VQPRIDRENRKLEEAAAVVPEAAKVMARDTAWYHADLTVEMASEAGAHRAHWDAALAERQERRRR
jgi:hypothetical protein